jgi:hypothetical protein
LVVHPVAQKVTVRLHSDIGGMYSDAKLNFHERQGPEVICVRRSRWLVPFYTMLVRFNTLRNI